MKEAEANGAAKGIRIITAEAGSKADLEQAFKGFAAARVQALIVFRDFLFVSERDEIVSLALALHLPSIFGEPTSVDGGGLISYGTDPLASNAPRAAEFVDKILKGTKPADIPVEFPTKIEMVVNLKTAKAIGLTVPPTLLVRADR